jgi:hypothetical protein
MAPKLAIAPGAVSRISSIVRMQALLFDVPSPREYDELLDFAEDRRWSKIERVVSVLRAQEILVGSGEFLRGPRADAAAAEIPGLISYARSLLEADRGPDRRLAVLPRNLGRSFAAKPWGMPLFGDFRPAQPPGEGMIVLYSSLEGNGRTARISAGRLGPGCGLSYDGPALLVDFKGPWLALDALSLEAAGPEARAEDGARRDRFEYSRFALSLDRRPARRRFRGRRADPYRYEYAYLFYTAGAAANVARFVSDLLSGVFHVPLREAERVAEAFSGRLP